MLWLDSITLRKWADDVKPQKHARIHRPATARGLVRTFKQVKRERAAERQLMGLSDYTLRDIGISRTDIPFIALGMPPRTD